MTEWLDRTRCDTCNVPDQRLQTPATCPQCKADRTIERLLDALGGPQETMEAAGFTNRGSLAYAMTHRGFPEPVKVLRGIRLWDLDAVKEWTNERKTP